MRPIRVGYRANRLAEVQAKQITSHFKELGLDPEFHSISTRGDALSEVLSDELEGSGLYSRELENALQNNQIDIAIHRMCELPVRSPDALCLTALSERLDPSDWLLVRKDIAVKKLFKLPENARVGTSTNRRKAQLLHYRPDLNVIDSLEDPDWVFERLSNDHFDGALLPAAALIRLEKNLEQFELIRFNAREFVPAPAQGVLAIQARRDDLETRRAVKALHHPEVALCTNVERSVLRLFDDQAHLPLGVYCERDPIGHYHVWAAFAESKNAPLKQVQYSQSTTDGLADQIYSLLQTG